MHASSFHLRRLLQNDLRRRIYLPTAYVVRREGYVLTRVCPSIHLSVHRGGYPCQVQLGEGIPQPGPVGVGYTSQVQLGGYPLLGVPQLGCTPARGDPPGVLPPSQVRMGYPVGQDRTAHGVLDKRRSVASWVHAGGLSSLEVSIKNPIIHWYS